MNPAMHLPPLRSGHSASAELIARRAAAGSRYPVHPRVGIVERRYGGVACLVGEVPEARGTMLYLHGGGFRLGSAQASIGFASHLAAASGWRVVMPQYRLAPEHPFPAALHDIDAVAGELLQYEDRLVLCGDSAGGNLAAASALQLGARAARMVGLILISPWLALTPLGDSFMRNAHKDRLFSRAQAEDAAMAYLQGHAADDPLASPLLGSVAHVPPTLIAVGGAEVLLDDSLAFAAKLARAGCAVELHCVPDMQHVAVTLDPAWPGARRTFDVMIDFLDRLQQAQATVDDTTHAEKKRNARTT